MQVIARMHGQMIKNVGQVQARQKRAYVSRKGKQLFVSFTEGETYVKMKETKKKKSLASSWEGPFFFMKYLDNNGFQEQDKGGKTYALKGKDEKL